MKPRLRMFAGPNGSGKSTLAAWLSSDYAVNLYHYINADVMFAEIAKSNRLSCPIQAENEKLLAFVKESTFPAKERMHFEK